jgi:hypothetical protein
MLTLPYQAIARTWDLGSMNFGCQQRQIQVSPPYNPTVHDSTDDTHKGPVRVGVKRREQPE